MKLTLTIIFILALSSADFAQRSGSALRSNAGRGFRAVVIDERLAVLRNLPGFYSRTSRRLRRGRILKVTGSKAADGALFYSVSMPPKTIGWVQAEALAHLSGGGGDTRLARLVYGSSGFDRIERASIFLENFPGSPLRPPMLLLFGDLIEESAVELSKTATRRLEQSEMAASGAPLHGFYLNFPGLDRYSRLGIEFLFDPEAKRFHYDGTVWRELVKKFPGSPEAGEARLRLEPLKQ